MEDIYEIVHEKYRNLTSLFVSWIREVFKSLFFPKAANPKRPTIHLNLR